MFPVIVVVYVATSLANKDEYIEKKLLKVGLHCRNTIKHLDHKKTVI